MTERPGSGIDSSLVHARVNVDNHPRAGGHFGQAVHGPCPVGRPGRPGQPRPRFRSSNDGFQFPAGVRWRPTRRPDSPIPALNCGTTCPGMPRTIRRIPVPKTGLNRGNSSGLETVKYRPTSMLRMKGLRRHRLFLTKETLKKPTDYGNTRTPGARWGPYEQAISEQFWICDDGFDRDSSRRMPARTRTLDS